VSIEIFVTSVFVSAVASVVIIIVQWIHNLFQSWKSFKKFEGKYKGYSYASQDLQSDKYNIHEENNTSIIITYESLNKLKIVNTDGGQTWEGFIYMRNRNIGDLTWKYSQEPLRIGSKEISFWETGAEKIVYMNERFDKKYGRELLIKEVTK